MKESLIVSREGSGHDQQSASQNGAHQALYGGKKGYGFVRPEDGGIAVFVHHTCMAPHAGPKYLEERVRVSYEVASKKICGLWAKNVRFIDQPTNVTTANRGETRV